MHPDPPHYVERLYRLVAAAGFGAAWTALRLSGSATDTLRSRSGQVPEGRSPVLWFHGASAGEMTGAVRLVELLRNDGFSFTAAYTAANPTGVKLAATYAQNGDVTTLAPWDVLRWVRRAFDRWQPEALFLVEGELWPSLVMEGARRRVPIFCVSARIYRRDVLGYTIIRPLLRPMLQRMTAILTVDDIERQRFIDLGAPPERCFTAGNLKYVATHRASDTSELERMLEGVSRDRLVVCGSIHADEIPGLFSALDALPRDVRIIIAPRHVDAAPIIMNEALRRGWRTCARSTGQPVADWRVLALDSIGELSGAYGLGCVAVVGGGFRRHGGHNPFEAVREGTPVLLGPHFDNFASEAAVLCSASPQTRVHDFHDLARQLLTWLGDPAQRLHAQSRQRAALPNAAQIADQYRTRLSRWLRQCGKQGA